MIKVISIGNSFSQDATTYLYDIAKAAGIDVKVVNLFIGGCSLATHWDNVVKDAAEYDYFLNGIETGVKISIKDALREENWDYITLQQASGDSGILESYYPYITDLYNYVKEQVPSAKILLHQTWAYEVDSDHQDFCKYSCDQFKMHQAIDMTYSKLSESMGLSVIPSGKVINELRTYPTFDYMHGGMSLCRDGFHMNEVYGRYALASTWYEFILQKSILDNSFLPPKINDEIDIIKIKLIQNVVHKICSDIVKNLM